MSSAHAIAAHEARQDQRFRHKLEITGDSSHQFFTGFSENISAGGLFISTYQIQPIGSTFRISFKIPGIEHEFDSTVEVRWVREYDERQPEMMPGMGVRFLSLTSRESEVLTELVQRIDTIFYDD